MTSQLAASEATRLSVPRKAALAGEVLATYVRVRRMPKDDIVATLAALRACRPTISPAQPSGQRLGTCRRLGRAVTRTLAVMPTDSRCLIRSLVLVRLLARRGIESSLVIGIRPGPEFAAHAWVEREGVALLPAGGTAYERLVEL